MDPSAFDTLAKAHAQQGTRRWLVRLLASLPLVGALAVVSDDAEAAERPVDRVQGRTPQRNRKQRNNNKNTNNQNTNNNNSNTSKGSNQNTQGKCNARKCQQGCCAGRTCAAGTTWGQCGTGGAACQACATGQVCAAPTSQCASCSTTQPRASVCEASLNPDRHGCGPGDFPCLCVARVGTLTSFCARQVSCIPGASEPICATDADCQRGGAAGWACVIQGNDVVGCPGGCPGNVACAEPCT